MSVAFSPDGLYIVSGGRDDGVLRMWMIETGEIVRTFGVQEFHVTCVTFSPDGRYFVSDAKSSLKIWSTETGENVRTLNSRPEDVYLNQKNIGFSPDGKYIVSIGEYKTVNIWSFTTGNLLKTLGQFENTPQICGLYDPQTYTPFTYTLKIGFSDNLSTYSVIEETSRNKLITTRLSNSEMPTDARLPGRIWDYIESFNKK